MNCHPSLRKGILHQANGIQTGPPRRLRLLCASLFRGNGQDYQGAKPQDGCSGRWFTPAVGRDAGSDHHTRWDGYRLAAEFRERRRTVPRAVVCRRLLATAWHWHGGGESPDRGGSEVRSGDDPRGGEDKPRSTAVRTPRISHHARGRTQVLHAPRLSLLW